MLDIVAALDWVRDNIGRFGGDPNLVTIFGQSGGGRKVATLMSMPSAKGKFQRAIIESGAVLRLTTQEDAIKATELLLSELNLKPNQARDLQQVPMAQLLAANEAVVKKMPGREPGMTANSPMVDGKALPTHPWDPAAPALSANIPLLMGWAHTEETLYDRPTPEKLALDEAGLKQRAAKRLEADPDASHRRLPSSLSGRLALGSIHPDRHRSSPRSLLPRTRPPQIRAAGIRARLSLPLRLGNARRRRTHALAPHHRDSIRV